MHPHVGVSYAVCFSSSSSSSHLSVISDLATRLKSSMTVKENKVLYPPCSVPCISTWPESQSILHSRYYLFWMSRFHLLLHPGDERIITFEQFDILYVNMIPSHSVSSRKTSIVHNICRVQAVDVARGEVTNVDALHRRDAPNAQEGFGNDKVITQSE